MKTLEDICGTEHLYDCVKIPRSDYHWQADACYDEAARRGKPELYTQAYNRVRASV